MLQLEGRSPSDVWLRTVDSVLQWDGGQWIEHTVELGADELLRGMTLPDQGPPWLDGITTIPDPDCTDCPPKSVGFVQRLGEPRRDLVLSIQAIRAGRLVLAAGDEQLFGIQEEGVVDLTGEPTLIYDQGYQTDVRKMRVGSGGGVLVEMNKSIRRISESGIVEVRATDTGLLDFWPHLIDQAHVVIQSGQFHAVTFTADSGIPTLGSPNRWSHVGVSTDLEAWAIANNTVAHWDGLAWSESELIAPQGPLIGTRDAWMVHAGDTISHFENGTWVPSSQPVRGSAGFWGMEPLDTWLGTDDGIFRWNGTDWALETDSFSPAQISGSAPDNVWAADQPPFDPPDGVPPARFLRFDGTSWSDTGLEQPFSVTHFAVDAEGIVWVASGRAIASYDPNAP